MFQYLGFRARDGAPIPSRPSCKSPFAHCANLDRRVVHIVRTARVAAKISAGDQLANFSVDDDGLRLPGTPGSPKILVFRRPHTLHSRATPRQHPRPPQKSPSLLNRTPAFHNPTHGTRKALGRLHRAPAHQAHPYVRRGRTEVPRHAVLRRGKSHDRVPGAGQLSPTAQGSVAMGPTETNGAQTIQEHPLPFSPHRFACALRPHVIL
jgi:hypothetical protein